MEENRGKSQTCGEAVYTEKYIDFDEIFSTAVKMTSIRTILSLVAAEDYILNSQM